MSARRRFRLIDSGVEDGRRQMAFDAALVELHERGEVADTVRFMRFPPTVLVGRHQILAAEVHVDRCRAEGVGLVRRISGGGAIYLDEGQVGWELVMRRSTLGLGTLSAHAQAICEAVAAGLSEKFGIPARFRPRNDIEVDGRKISGSGGFFVGDTLVYQGTVLVDMDAGRMMRLLNIPAPKLARHGAASGAARVVTLKELLGRSPSIVEVHEAVLHGLARRLGIDATPAEPGPAELDLAARLHDEEIGRDSFVFGTTLSAGEDIHEAVSDTPGGTICVQVRLEGPCGARRIREMLISGDFFVAPPRFVYDLEAALRGLAVAQVEEAVSLHLATSLPELMSVPTEVLQRTILLAIRGSPETPDSSC